MAISSGGFSEVATRIKYYTAFDILISWFEANRPDLLDALTEVLGELSKNNRINFIKEPKIGVYHVAFNRTTIQ